MNVIGFCNDSWRYDHLGYNGNDWIKTPCLDALAKESMVFDRMFAEGLPTLPVRTAFFTGRYTFPFRGWQRLEPTDIPIAEVLWSQGYRSALVTDCYHLHKPGMAFERGFDDVCWIRGQEVDPLVVDPDIKVDITPYHKEGPNDKLTKKQLEQHLKNRAHWKSDEDCYMAQVVKESIDWLEKQVKRGNRDRLFLWADAFDPHEPWDPLPPYDTMYTDPNYKGKNIIHAIPGPIDYLTEEEVKYIKALYAGKCTQTDKWVGIFVDKVRELGLLDNTLLIWTTDHGEPFGEHGIIKKAEPWPYQEESHMPFMIRHPEGFGAGQRCDAEVQTPDVMPTMLDFLGVKLPPRVHGKSLLPLMKGEVDKLRDYGYVGRYGRSWRIHNKQWAYHMYFTKRPDELFRVDEDPEEQVNVIDKHPDVVNDLEVKLRRFVEKLR